MVLHKKDWLRWICESENSQVLRDKYDQWADSYDVDTGEAWGHVPVQAAALLGPEPRDIEILDAGAGTGLAGQALAMLGFRNITAVDFSPVMLGRAEALGVYRQLVLGDLLDPGLFPTSRTFDAIIATGLFAESHAGAEVLRRLCGLLRDGGWLVLTARESRLTSMAATIADLPIVARESRETKIYQGHRMQIRAYYKGKDGIQQS